ncbi:MAG: TRAP transporter large permease subunit, partial [Planctomycetota bacterium]
MIDFSRRLFRNSTGGPAKVAVLSSGMMGSLSGSAVANTATTGTFTIPMMKSSGFKPELAAGVEAAASSGGALMPPIMGAGA